MASLIDLWIADLQERLTAAGVVDLEQYSFNDLFRLALETEGEGGGGGGGGATEIIICPGETANIEGLSSSFGKLGGFNTLTLTQNGDTTHGTAIPKGAFEGWTTYDVLTYTACSGTPGVANAVIRYRYAEILVGSTPTAFTNGTSVVVALDGVTYANIQEHILAEGLAVPTQPFMSAAIERLSTSDVRDDLTAPLHFFALILRKAS